MCLAVPGKLVEVRPQDDLPMGRVEFGGIVKDVCLAYTPEAQVGDYVLVHVGFALSRIDEAEAREMFQLLEEIGDFGENDEGRMTSDERSSKPEIQSPKTEDPRPESA
jgi:hydrogenase expression/formation protein HypC